MAFGVRGFQFLGERAPDPFLSSALFLRAGLYERTDVRALVEVGVVYVSAGSDEFDDLVA